MQTKREIHELVDRLPESETGAAARYLEFLLAHDEAAIDPGMLKRIDEARARRGPGISHAEILREFGAGSGSYGNRRRAATCAGLTEKRLCGY